MTDPPGCYLLVMCLEESKRLTVGRLGTFDFPAGHYIYIGSAMGGMEARIARHLRSQKRRHWHIDYLLETAPVRTVVRFPATDRLECILSRQVASLPEAGVVALRFGSSDCCCPAHLIYFQNSPEARIGQFLPCFARNGQKPVISPVTGLDK